MIYLDYSATTPVNKQVLDSFNKVCLDYIGNPNSLHKLGNDSHKLMDAATYQISDLLGVKSNEIIFTSGASESNNLAIFGVLNQYTSRGKHIVTTKLEHSSILAGMNYLKQNGYIVDYVKVDDDGKIDFDDLDEKLSKVRMMILCNPQNPVGKIWSKDELKQIGELCKKHNVILVSDEIHCELTDPGKHYNPFMTSSDYENSILAISPSKSFNVAGFQSSVVYSKNTELLERIKTQLHIDNSDSCNVFAVSAVEAAYNDSEDWLEELKEVLYENKQIVKEFLESELPIIKLIDCDATYLLWLDCRKLNVSSNVLKEFLRQNQGLFLSAGSDFGEVGDGFLRLNIACPPKLLKDGLSKLKAGVIALNNINNLSKNI